MKRVLDASVALKWVLDEPDREKALELRDEYRAERCQLLAPDAILLEIAHVLSKAEGQRKIDSGQADVLFSDILESPPILYPFLPLLPRAMELSRQGRIGVHDCLYVALAEIEGCELLTADERIAKALPRAPIQVFNSMT